jgi:hypothetical protein
MSPQSWLLPPAWVGRRNEVRLQLVEAVAPHLAVGLEPLVELDEGLCPEAVHPALAVRPGDDEPRVAEHTEVLGHSGLAQGKPLDQDVHGLLTTPERIEDQAPARLGEHLDRR